MSQKDFISDGLTNQDIVNVIKEIREKIKNDIYSKEKDDNVRYEKLKTEYEFFSSRYPMLFELSINNNDFDWESLNYMLSMRSKIENDEITTDKASTIVGKVWYDKHIKIPDVPTSKRQRK
jgi:hypothetical protein